MASGKSYLTRAINSIHLIVSFVPLLFTISLFALFFIEGARTGHLPDTIKHETPRSFLRSVSIFLLLARYLSTVLKEAFEFTWGKFVASFCITTSVLASGIFYHKTDMVKLAFSDTGFVKLLD